MWAIFPELNSLRRLHSGSKRQRKIHPCVFKRRIKTGRRGWFVRSRSTIEKEINIKKYKAVFFTVFFIVFYRLVSH